MLNNCLVDTLGADEVDSDGDGYVACSLAESGWAGSESKLGGDCDDGNAEINPTTLWYADEDGDAYGTNDTRLTR